MAFRFRKLRRRIIIAAVFIVAVMIADDVYVLLRWFIEPHGSDDSIITQDPCALPCWQGLTLGVSTRKSVKNFISESDFIPDWTVDDGPNPNYIRWHRSRNQRGYFRFDENDTLIAIEIYPNYPFSIQKFIELYGEPEAIKSRVERTRNNSIFLVRVYLYYPSKGLIVDSSFETEWADNFELTTEMQGTGIEIFGGISSFVDLVDTRVSLPRDEIPEYIQNRMILGWPGFGAMLTSRPGESPIFSSMIAYTPTPIP